MLIGKTEFNIPQRKRTEGLISPRKFPFMESVSLSSINRLNKEPLNNNSTDLSFKGSFLYTSANKSNKYIKSELIDFAKKNLGHMGEDLYNHVASSKLNIAHKMFYEAKGGEIFNIKTGEIVDKIDPAMPQLFRTLEEGEVIFHKKSIPHLVGDGLVLKNLPSDILNGVVDLVGKIKPFKKWSEKTHNSDFMKSLRAESKIEAQISALRGLAETRAKLLKDGKTEEEIRSAIFQRKMKMFDPKTGNYDTKHERSLNRIVSGIPPALFLANDAYNLSRMMDDNKDKAEHEKKIRFRQEMSRIFINAYITLITFGALQKVMNNSNAGIMLTTGLTALFTESVSRLSNGKHIKRLSPEEAREENKKNNAPEKDIKPDTSFKAASKAKTDNRAQQKPLLSIDTLAKASAGVIAAGFALKGLRKVSAIDNAIKSSFKPFKNLYDKLTTIHDYRIDKTKFDEIVKVLKENGFSEDIAEDYTRVSKYAQNADGTISLGARDKKVKPLVNFVIAPFKFAWSTVTLPYRLVDKAIKSFTHQPKTVKVPINDEKTIKVIAENMQKDLNLTNDFAKDIEKFVKELKNTPAEKLSETQKQFLCRVGDVEALAKSVDNIGKRALEENFDAKKFHDYVCDNLLKSFNVDTMSNVSNAELSNLAKTAATAATLWFLMTDNYNMVMLKSNGNDVEGAQTKFKERFVQEGSRLFYQTLLIDLFNSTFRNQYNKSLFGMTWITLTNTTMGEWLTRKSVGVAVGAHTRDELLKMEEKQDNATGFLKGYYNFMQRLTGKRSIKSYDVSKSDIKEEIQKIKDEDEIPFASSNNRIKQVIKA